MCYEGESFYKNRWWVGKLWRWWVWDDFWVLIRCEGESFVEFCEIGQWGELWRGRFELWHWVSYVKWVDERCWWERVNALLLMGESCWSMLMFCRFGVLKMRAETNLMRRRDERKDLSYQVGPTGFESIYSAATRSVVYCLKIGPRWFQKASFKNHIFNNIVQTTLNIDTLPNTCFFFFFWEHQC